MILGTNNARLPNLSMAHPANGPSRPPSALAKENTRLVWAWVSPRESRTAGTNTVKPRKKMPLEKNAIAEHMPTIHQP